MILNLLSFKTQSEIDDVILNKKVSVSSDVIEKYNKDDVIVLLLNSKIKAVFKVTESEAADNIILMTVHIPIQLICSLTSKKFLSITRFTFTLNNEWGCGIDEEDVLNCVKNNNTLEGDNAQKIVDYLLSYANDNTIKNCKFAFKCPMHWGNLLKTDNEKIRFCHNCEEEVYECESDEELDYHTSKKHCVAIKEKPRAKLLLGKVSPNRNEDFYL